MNEENQETPSLLTSMNGKQLLQLLLLGLIAGMAIWAVTFVLKEYVFTTILCHGSQTMRCQPAELYSEGIAIVLGSLAVLFGMVKQQIFRPLLVVIAVAISFWGVVAALSGLTWYYSLAVTALFYMVGYAAFAWIARIRIFWAVLALMLALVVAIRLVLMA